MAATPNEYTLKGKLQIVIPGTEGVIELGDVEVPIRVDFGNKPNKPGMVMRGITPDDQREMVVQQRAAERQVTRR